MPQWSTREIMDLCLPVQDNPTWYSLHCATPNCGSWIWIEKTEDGRYQRCCHVWQRMGDVLMAPRRSGAVCRRVPRRRLTVWPWISVRHVRFQQHMARPKAKHKQSCQYSRHIPRHAVSQCGWFTWALGVEKKHGQVNHGEMFEWIYEYFHYMEITGWSPF